MPENILGEYRRARRAALIGTICLYVMATLLAVAALVCGSTLVRGTLSRGIPTVTRLLRYASAAVATVLLAEFLRHFGRSSSPFGGRQSLRLGAAGLLLILNTALGFFDPTSSYGARLLGVPLPAGTSPQPGINPLMFSFAVFLFCLALVNRYGNLLKEDLDSIA